VPYITALATTDAFVDVLTCVRLHACMSPQIMATVFVCSCACVLSFSERVVTVFIPTKILLLLIIDQLTPPSDRIYKSRHLNTSLFFIIVIIIIIIIIIHFIRNSDKAMMRLVILVFISKLTDIGDTPPPPTRPT